MATTPFQVAIVGCGISGLAAAIGITNAGHKVTIFERASKLAQVGAGIQIAPNTTGILKQWGLLAHIISHSVELQYLQLRSYRDGAVISASQIDPQMKTAYGVPYLAIHRADLAQVLLENAEMLGVRTRFGAQIIEVDPLRPSIKLADGEQFSCDFILGADGLHSMCRELIPGQAQQPFFPGDIAFRIVLPISDLIESKELIELTQRPAVQIIMGPGAHVVLYPLKGCELYNIVFLLADEKFPEDILANRYDTTADKDRLEWLRTRFSTWSGAIQAILATAAGATVWRLEHCQEATQWTHEAGRLALIGDACHAILPYLGQGAALAIEDGAFLGSLFEDIRDPHDIKGALQLYETTRKPRTIVVAQKSIENREIFNLKDGQNQQKRDEMMKQGPPSLTEFQQWLYGYDAIAEGRSAAEKYNQIELGVNLRLSVW
ncbi:hypothetical protein MMC26_006633 [Xylographa opegraphella]|nr:hypothetical protein [Xylographa opegraphella]